MKKHNKPLFLLFVLGLFLLFPASLSAQFRYQTKGTKFHYKTEDLKENKQSIETQVISELRQENGTCILQLAIPADTTVNDVYVGDVPAAQYICDANGVTKVVLMSGENLKRQIMDITSAVIEQSEEGTSKEEVQAKLDEMIESNGEISVELKPDAKKGERIPKCKLTSKMMFVKYTVTLSDGEYEGNETVSTPFGEIECIKISYRLKMSAMMSTVTDSYMTEWYSPEYGLVKSEERDKKGKILARQILESIE